MVLTFKLQSPNYTGVAGDSLSIPVSIDTLQGSSLAQILTLFRGNNAILDFGQLREIVQIVGSLTTQASAEAEGVVGGVATTVANPVHFRDLLRRTRTTWPLESASGNWGSATLPAAEQDAATSRANGKARMIYEKAWNAGSASFVNFFLYGTVMDYRFGPRAAASGRVKIPYSITFGVGLVKVG